MKTFALTAVLGATAALCDHRETYTMYITGHPERRALRANDHYGDNVRAAAIAISDPILKAKARMVASVGTFLWLDTIASTATLEKHISATDCSEIFGIVINDPPARACSSTGPIGELPTISQYKKEYIDRIVTVIKAYPNVAIAAIVEPYAIPDIVTNANLASCQAIAVVYREAITYALKNLNFPNVATYLDAGHGGWLGWDENLRPGAQEFANLYKAAGYPSSFRGFSTNVANWNAWSLHPGEFENNPDSQYNKALDESRFVTLFGAALANISVPNHAIVDTSRNAIQGLRLEWGDWCNVNGAGFGVRPNSTTGNTLADAFVWVKHGGESDGTSDTSDVRYSSFCGKADAYKPSPDAGTWNQGYFEMLLKNAIPPF